MQKLFLTGFSILAILFGCQQSEQKKESAKSVEIPKNRATFVNTYPTKLIDFNYLIQSTGKIRPLNEQNIIAETSGTIKINNLKNSARTSQGQILIMIDTRALQLKIEKVQENIFSSKLNYQSDLLSQESLLANKSKGVRDTVYRKLKSNVGLTESEIELKNLKLELQKSIVRAPFSGTVANVNVQNGQFVRAGDHLFTIYTNNELFLEAKILETEIGDIKIGQLAEVIPVSGQKKYSANLVELNPIVDENGMILLKLKLKETTGLLPGMNAICSIIIPNNKCLTVPKSAIVMRNGKAVVFTFENGHSKWNYVILGRDNGRQVEIKEGLKIGQKVIISNNVQLAHDSPVKEEVK